MRWDDVDPASYAAPGTFTVRGNVVRGSADRPVATVTVTDSADPVVTLTTGSVDGESGWWLSDPVRVGATASDASGVDSVETSVDGSPWSTTSGASASALVSGDGAHTVTARALDRTGNASTAVTELRIDATDPVSRATYDAGGRQVSVRAADTTSGLSGIETRVGAGTWAPYAGPLQVGAAATTVEYRAVDQAGNVESANSMMVPATGTGLRQSSVAASLAEPTARYGSRVPVAVRVVGSGNAPTGPVRIVLGARLLASGLLVDGRVRLSVDSAGVGVGPHVLRVLYDGTGTHRSSATTVDLRVIPASSRTTVRLDVSGDGERAVARVRVETDPAGQTPDRVRATLLKGGKAVRTKWLDLSARGRAKWKVSPERPDVYKVRVVTRSSPTLTRSSDTGRARSSAWRCTASRTHLQAGI